MVFSSESRIVSEDKDKGGGEGMPSTDYVGENFVREQTIQAIGRPRNLLFYVISRNGHDPESKRPEAA
jgi:hypothetical protein